MDKKYVVVIKQQADEGAWAHTVKAGPFDGLADATDFVSTIGGELLHTVWDEISIMLQMPEAEEVN
jgi:hypothetical protein